MNDLKMVVERYEYPLYSASSQIEMDCRPYSWGNRSSRPVGAILGGLRFLSNHRMGDYLINLSDTQKILPPLALTAILPPIFTTTLTSTGWAETLKNPLTRKPGIRKTQITNYTLIDNRHNRTAVALAETVV